MYNVCNKYRILHKKGIAEGVRVFCLYIDYIIHRIINMQRGQNKNKTETSIYKILFPSARLRYLHTKSLIFYLFPPLKGWHSRICFFFRSSIAISCSLFCLYCQLFFTISVLLRVWENIFFSNSFCRCYIIPLAKLLILHCCLEDGSVLQRATI